MYKCECGKEFEKKTSLISHARFCDKYVKKCHQPSKYKIGDNLYKCECGREFNNFQSLNAHFSHCEHHHQVNGTNRKLRPNEIYHTMCWDKKTEEELQEIRLRGRQTFKEKIRSGETSGVFKGRKHTEDTKEKIRKSTLKHIESCNGVCRPRYSKKACLFIDKLNEDKNWHLQHAENGGEKHVGKYWVDGYDEQLNIVFEYDEVSHYDDVSNNKLKEKDRIRQEKIINMLNCEFWRYNEYINLLYKVQ